jgi:hypothetical protein
MYISQELGRVSDVDSKLTLLAGWGEMQVRPRCT